jgi:hypothetical protein
MGASNPRIAASAVLRDLIHLAKEVPEPILNHHGPTAG